MNMCKGKNALIAMIVTVTGLATAVPAGLQVPCPEDTNGDLVVNVLDLIDVLLCFGLPADPPCDEGQDVNGDNVINVLDLIDVLLKFGVACPPPLNNLCDDRAVILNGLTPYDTTSAITDGEPHGPGPGGDPPGCDFGLGINYNDIWYTYTATCTGQLTVSTCTENGGDALYDSELTVYTGCDCGALADPPLGCSDDFGSGCTATGVGFEGLAAKVEVLVQSGQCYTIRVGGSGPDDQGAGTLSIFCQLVDVDLCIGAEILTLAAVPVVETVSGGNTTTVGATVDFGVPECLDQITGLPVEVLAPGHWYSVTGNGSTLTATTCNARSIYDTAISVYSGSCGNWFCIGNDGASDDGGIPCVLAGGVTPDQSLVTWCSVAGVEYLILVHGKNANSTGAYRLDIISDGVECSICEPGKIPEAEPDCVDEYVDVTNGGCSTTVEPFMFFDIVCGDEICGRYGNFLRENPNNPKGDPLEIRDTDWYQIEIFVNTIFTWKVTGECDTLFGVVGAQGVPDCTDAVFLESAVTGPSQRGEVTTACQSPGTYWFFVAPGNFTGCACGSQYNALLTCDDKGGAGCIQTFDQCNAADPIFDGLTEFDTSGMSTDGPPHASCQYDGQTYHDVWYNYTATCSGTLTVTTCEDLGGSATYDSDLAIYAGCICGGGLEDPPLGCNDDDLPFPGAGNPCGIGPGFQSTLRVPVAAGDCYKIRVGGFQNGDQGPGELLITCDPCGAGDVVCDEGKIQEDEPNCGLPVDTVNGGCNTTPQLFETLICGDEFCGTSQFDGFRRDSDWFQITIAQPQIITWSVTAEFAVEIFVYSGTCAALLEQASATAVPCSQATATTPCLAAGTYILLVQPPTTVFFECLTYNASVICEAPCTPPASANLCEDRVDLVDGLNPYTTLGATTDGLATSGLGDCDAFVGGNPQVNQDIWFNYTATCTGTLTLSTCNDGDPLTGDSTYDSKIAIYDGCDTVDCPYGGNEIGCNDDGPGCAGFSTIATAPVVMGQCYKVRVGGFSVDDFGPATMSVSCQ